MVVTVLIVIVGGWVNQGVVGFHFVLPSAFSVDWKCSPPCCGGLSTPGVWSNHSGEAKVTAGLCLVSVLTCNRWGLLCSWYVHLLQLIYGFSNNKSVIGGLLCSSVIHRLVSPWASFPTGYTFFWTKYRQRYLFKTRSGSDSLLLLRDIVMTVLFCFFEVHL